jgi:hypothetical protein
MFINVYHVFVSCYEFLKREREPFRFHSIIEFCSSTEMHKNLDDKYSPTIDVSIWFIWRWYVAKAINKYKCPFVCEEKVTVEQGLESVRIFLKDKYLLDKEDAPLKIAFKELQSIIDPEAILAENFRRSWKPLDLFKRGLQWFFSNFKKTKTLAELDLIQPKHDINFEHTEIWKFWLACIEKAKKFNVTFKYNKKK